MTSQAESLVTSYRPDFASLVPPIRPLPKRNEPQVPVYPGQMEGQRSFAERLLLTRRRRVRCSSTEWAAAPTTGQTSCTCWSRRSQASPWTYPVMGSAIRHRTTNTALAVTRRQSSSCSNPRAASQFTCSATPLGGITSVAVAARHPELVKSLTLISPAMLTRAVMVKAHAPKALKIATAKRKSEKLGAQAFAEQQADELMALCYADQSDCHRNVAKPSLLRSTPDCVALQLRHRCGIGASLVRRGRAGKGKSIWRLARHVEAPTFAIFGTEDQLVPVELAPRGRSLQERSGDDLA